MALTPEEIRACSRLVAARIFAAGATATLDLIVLDAIVAATAMAIDRVTQVVLDSVPPEIGAALTPEQIRAIPTVVVNFLGERI